MDRKSLIYASAGVAVLALLAGVLTYSGGGLNPQTQAGLATADQLLNSSRANYRELSREARSLIDSMTELPQPRREQWLARLTRSEKDLDSASSELDQAKELAAQDDDKLRVEIESRIGQARQKRTQALQAASEILDLARTVSEVDKNRGRYIGEARASYRQLAAYRPASVPGAGRAMIDWPEKKADLSQAIQRMADVKARSASLWKERSRAIAAPDADGLLILETHQSLQADGLQLARLDSQLGQRVGQLYLSWDRILVDMEIREGETLTLHHKYKTVTVQIQDPQKKQGAHSEREAWVPVSKATFDALEGKLGMSVARKPAGKYEEEAEVLAQPAGYSYLAPPGQSNQYGQWRRDSHGGSFWAFYGQYMFMSSLFWGPAYRPIFPNDYNNYRRSHTSGRTYYGRTAAGRPRYGTNSRMTASGYRSSRYVRSGGYRNSYYKQSGGNLRGYRSSRYRTAGASGRGGSYRSRGSRSFGGK